MPNACAPATAAAARAFLAHAALGVDPRPEDARVGPLELRPHQRHAAARLRYALHHYRVALLADDVGLGKTAVALALLRDAPNAIVVAPAALRPHWTAALHSAALTRALYTTESLGRPHQRDATAPPDAIAPPLVVVDEAHAFRNPRTRRWRALAALAADARLLLLSATPVHNRPDDLAALFALALGAHAAALDAPTLARLVVRRSATDLHPRRTPGRHHDDAPALDRPEVTPTTWLTLDDAPTVIAALRHIPPSLAPRDGTAQPDLDRYTLVRLWTSSDAALRAALRRRRARALALEDALTARHHATRADLATLTRGLEADPTTLQLSLLPAAAAHAPPPECAHPAILAAYATALQDALAAVAQSSGDALRVAHLRAIRARHPGARVVGFSHSADTVRALYRALAPDARVAMLTASGGRIASGTLPRAEILSRFAPLGQDRPEPPEIERITLLLTTDVLSEGLDLRDAAVVVHLDLPWTPARLAQRTGRAIRPGAPHPVVHVYAFRPPPAAARDLRLALHARAKRDAVDRTLGSSALETAVTPDHGDPPVRRRPVAVAQLARDRALERWSAPASSSGRPSAPQRRIITAVHCPTSGYLAVVALPTRLGALRVPTLVASVHDRPPTCDPATVHQALALLARARTTTSPPPASVANARRQLARWSRRELARATVACTPSIVHTGRPHATRAGTRAALLARAHRALDAAPPDLRARLAAPVATLRDVLAHPLSAEYERAIRDAAPDAPTDAAWLSAAAEIAAAVGAVAAASGDVVPHPAAPRPALRALVLFVA